MISPDQVFFTRDQLLEQLNTRGYPIKASYFGKMCLPSRSAGPPVAKWFGRRPLYTLADGLAWAESRCRNAVASAA
jgi:hypothetical protein